MSDVTRFDGRRPDEARPLSIERPYYDYTSGSVLIKTGDTHVLCVATVEKRVPGWLEGKGTGWVTAEYGMLPGSSPQRIRREAGRKVGGRTSEIQRLIGRSLRSVTDLAARGEQSIIVDCDVLQADGGTRTAAITGAFIALADALAGLVEAGEIKKMPLTDYLAATSVGVIKGTPCLDLPYVEDSTAEVDMNVVMTGSGKYVEVQGTAEEKPFSREDNDELLSLAWNGIERLVETQRGILDLDLPGA